ncbi:MAG: thioredoxin domain-containing protein, partial [Leadbetterella sp.]|nr:thioredoxin domain-containing protein [Leadbetterella sp.]
ANQPPETENWVTRKFLSELAKKESTSIDTETLEKCLKDETYRKQVEKNTLYGMKLLKGKLSTPALFIDGKFVSKLNYVTIQKMINDALANQKIPTRNKEEVNGHRN